MNRRKETQAEPFLKWVGGKARRVNEILDLMPEQIDYYLEPFLGGGAVALEVLRRNPDCKALLSDLNPHLINCWRQVKENPQGVIRSVHALDDRYLRLKFADEQKSFYMAVRERWNIYMAVLERCNKSMGDEGSGGEAGRAGMFLWLNRNCFQGMWRVNSRGEFNVPPRQHHTEESRVNYEAIEQASVLLRNADIQQGGFDEFVMAPGTVVFVDPPYIRENNGRGFTAYTKDDFTDADHLALAEKLRLSGATYVLTIGGDEDIVREIYGQPDSVSEIPCTFAATNTGRRTRNEFIITNNLHKKSK